MVHSQPISTVLHSHWLLLKLLQQSRAEFVPAVSTSGWLWWVWWWNICFAVLGALVSDPYSGYLTGFSLTGAGNPAGLTSVMMTISRDRMMLSEALPQSWSHLRVSFNHQFRIRCARVRSVCIYHCGQSVVRERLHGHPRHCQWGCSCCRWCRLA